MTIESTASSTPAPGIADLKSADVESARKTISDLQLEPHPEGGHFRVTYVAEETLPTPYAPGTPIRPLASVIYYYLSPLSARGYLHMNLSTTVHTLVRGRARYTLLRRVGADTEVREVVLGLDTRAGETAMLIVQGGWWKASELIDGDKECLITETVFPGFDYADHAFVTHAKLAELFPEDGAMRTKYAPYCKANEDDKAAPDDPYEVERTEKNRRRLEDVEVC